MVADQIRDFLENGNVHNSVNFPEVWLARSTAHRLVCASTTGPAIAGRISETLKQAGVAIHGMANLSRGDVAYLVADLDAAPSTSVVDAIAAQDGVRMVRSI